MVVMSSCCRYSVIYCAYAWPIASLLLFPFEQRLSSRDSGIKYVFLKSSKSHNGTLDSFYNTSDFGSQLSLLSSCPPITKQGEKALTKRDWNSRNKRKND